MTLITVIGEQATEMRSEKTEVINEIGNKFVYVGHVRN